jgi:hypothetical protein
MPRSRQSALTARRDASVYTRRWVVWRDGDDGARAVGDRSSKRLDPRLVVVVGRDRHRPAIQHVDRHLVIEVEGRVEDDLVARHRDRLDGVVERHVRARGDDDAPALQVDAVLGTQLRRDALAKLRQARALLVFVRRRFGEGAPHRLDGGGRRLVVHRRPGRARWCRGSAG